MSKVVVLDHSLTVRMDLDEAFRAAGWTTVLCASVAAAREALRQGLTDAMVLDVVLPDASGLDLLGEMRADPALAGVPVLLLSSEDEVAGKLAQLRVAADEYVGKPYERDDVVSRAQRMAQARRSPPLVAPPCLVLAVDDSPTYLNELGAQLRGDGHEVIQAQSGSEALAVLAVRSPDCILLDMMMPQISGEQLCRRIKQTPAWRPIPVIMLTGRDDEGAILESFNAGADDYVAKSSNFTVLRARLNAQLRRRHLESETLRIQEELHRRDVEVIELDAEIAERKRTEAEIKQLVHALEIQIAATGQAEAANRAKSAFLANMSHELRTPLNVILGFSRLIANEPQVTEDQAQKLNLIVHSGEKLLRLIDNVLDLAKIESGHLELESTQFDLHLLLHQMQSMMHLQAVQKQLSVTLELAADLPQYIKADSAKLHQILLNLIGNAVKFTSTGGVILRAGLEAFEAQRRAVLRFEVEDSGPGIRESDRQRIFAPFVQLRDRLPAQAGTGLGLAISEQYVKLMGGRIAVTSILGKGSVFRFDIPVGVDPHWVQVVPVNEQRKRVTGIADGQPRYRLLIAEDHPDNRLLLRSILEPLGFDVREAVNGQEAVALCQSWHPHLIWMDMRMPVMHGLDATRRIREIDAGAKTKIVAVTAHALEDEQEQILAAGCDDFIRKPYAESAILDALVEHLGVRFVYAEQSSPVGHGEASELSPTQLERLPAELLLELRDAAVLLDESRCLELAERIDVRDQEFRGWLERMVEDLQYAELIRVLDDAIASRRA